MTTPRGLVRWLALDARLHPNVDRYRKELLDRIFVPIVAAGLVAVGLGAWRAAEDEQWGFAAAYLGLYLTGAAAAFVLRRQSLRSRSVLFLAAMFAVAVAGLLRLGLGGVGPLILIVFCGLSAILLGVKAALWAVALSVIALGAAGYALISGLVPLPPARPNVSLVPGAWLVMAATFVVVTVGLIMPLQGMSVRLTQSLRRLERETRRTERSNRRLRQEAKARKQAERALRASELRYRGIFEAASVGIMEEDVTGARALLAELRAAGVEDVRSYLEEHPEVVGRAAGSVKVRDANPAACQVYGASSTRELLQSLDRIFVADSLPGFREVLIALAEGRRHHRGEVVNQTLAGQRIHVLIQAAFPEDPAANVLVSVLDITDRKMLEQSLGEARKMQAIGTLAGGIAHDFNNLLMGVRGYATLLRLRFSEQGSNLEYIDSIDQLVDSGAALTAQLLGFASGGKYDLKTTDLCRLLDSSLTIFGRAKKEIAAELQLAADLWTVEVDRGQLEQVMLNLYVNAWQAMPKGGTLTVQAQNVVLDAEAAGLRAVPSGEYVRIAVRDTGVGMDAATRARVFEPFFTTKELGRGTGLGLASAYAIIKNHGGTIEVTSEVGAGSTFVLHLPASKKPVPARPRQSAKAQPGSETILLVDDETALRRATGMMLEELGYRVLTAANGAEALRIFGVDPDRVAAVVLDMIMPGMGGAEVLERLRERCPELPVLLSSGYSQDARADALLKQGSTAFLQKPFRMETLSERLRELLDGGDGTKPH